jgi:hypothetical protein
MDDTERDSLHDAIRRRVCAVCLDRRDDGSCGLDATRVCALEDHFARIVEAVTAADGRGLEECRQAIRERVCSECSLQDNEGSCRVQQRAECALDAYLPLVVDAIRELTAGPGPSKADSAREDP